MKEELKEMVSKGLCLSNHNEESEFRLLVGNDRVQERDLIISNATLQGLGNFVSVRKDDIIKRSAASHLIVDTRNSQIDLVLQEHGGQDDMDGTYKPSTKITGSSKFTNDRNTVKELMNSRMKPHDMAMKLRDLPHLFNSEEEWKKAVGTLRNINSVIEKTVKDSSNEDTGEREKRLHLVIKDGCPALEWTWKYAIYEGEAEDLVACRVLYEANDHMSGVNIALTNFDFERQERKALKKMMDNTIAFIMSFIGNALPVVYVN